MILFYESLTPEIMEITKKFASSGGRKQKADIAVDFLLREVLFGFQ